MASRRFRGRSSSRDRFQRREEFANRGFEAPARFREFDDKGREIPQFGGREERAEMALSARDRIRLENEMFDHKRHRSDSRNRRPSPGRSRRSKERSSSKNQRSRSPPRRDHNGDRRGHRESREMRSKERGGREVILQTEEHLRFEPPPNHHYEEVGDDGGRYDRFQPEDGSRMGNRFSPPGQSLEFHDVNLEREFEKSNYMQDGFIEYPGYRGSTGHNESSFVDNTNVHRDDNFAPRQNVPALMDIQPVPPPNQNISGFVDDSLQDFSEPRRPEDFQDNNTPLIPEFNPELSKLSSYEWVKLIEDSAKQFHWQKDEKQYIMASRLAGYARQWYLNTGILCKNWNELKLQFLQAFPTEMSYFNLLQKMLNRVKDDNESMATYFHHKVALLNACDIQGRKAVSCIIGGLQNRRLEVQAKLRNFEDPDELYLFLRSSNVELLQPMKVEKDNPFDHKKCFNCKEVGHIKSACPKNKPLPTKPPVKHEKESQGPPSSKINYEKESFNLQPSGHQVMYGSLARVPTLPKYFTEVNINGVTLRAYVDQQSESTTIRQASANSLKLPVKKEYKVIRGFYGNSFSSVGVVEVPLCIDRAIANVQLSVIPDHLQAIPIIVGKNFIGLQQIMLLKDGNKVRFYPRMDNGNQF